MNVSRLLRKNICVSLTNWVVTFIDSVITSRLRFISSITSAASAARPIAWICAEAMSSLIDEAVVYCWMSFARLRIVSASLRVLSFRRA
jgi:hypothetical protein